MEKRESSYTVDRNVSWCSQLMGGSSENEKQNYHTIQQSHSWYIPRQNYNLKRYMHPNVPSSTIHNSPDKETQMLIDR